MSIRFKDFEIRPCVRKTGTPHLFELVKWNDSNGGDTCFVVAIVEWNKKEPCWEFRSVGTRFIEYYEEGLCEYVKKVLDLLAFTNNFNDE